MTITPFQALRLAVAALKWRRARAQYKLALWQSGGKQTEAVIAAWRNFGKFTTGLNKACEGVEIETGQKCLDADRFLVPGIEPDPGYVPAQMKRRLEKRSAEREEALQENSPR